MKTYKLGITGKFFTIIILVIVVILAAISGRLIFKTNKLLQNQSEELISAMEMEQQRSQDAYEENLQAKGKLLAATIAHTASGLLLNYDFDAVERIANNMVQDRDINRVEFYDTDGNSIAIEGVEVEEGSGVIESGIIQQDVTLGKIRLFLSKEAMNEKLAKISGNISMQKTKSMEKQRNASRGLRFEFIIFSLLGLFALSIIIFILFNKMIVNPLRRDMKLAKAISDQGDLSYRLQMASADELGQLGNALDNMADGLKARAELAEIIASGDLQVEVELASDKDVLGKSLSNMTKRLNELLSAINASADQVASGSSQVSGASQTLSQGATEQASSLEEVTSSITELASQTKINAENASKATEQSVLVKKMAEEGNMLMQEMSIAMDDINQAGQNISKIIKVIDEIAFQTNLLALNAAVEAARAGQHGRGFAVVAEEVRNLAARSATAAKETSELIEGSVQKTTNGNEMAKQTSSAFHEIVQGIVQFADLVEDIAAKSNEQAQGINQINEGLGQIGEVTQQNSANAEESAAASEELSAQASQLRVMLSAFKLNKEYYNRAYETKQPQLMQHAQSELHTEAPKKNNMPIMPEEYLKLKGNEELIDLSDREFGKYTT